MAKGGDLEKGGEKKKRGRAISKKTKGKYLTGKEENNPLGTLDYQKTTDVRATDRRKRKKSLLKRGGEGGNKD